MKKFVVAGYGKSEKAYPASVKGKWRTFKWRLTALLLLLYYVAPFLRWDRGVGRPDQAFLVDMNVPKIFFLWIEIWPQEIYYITAIMLMGACLLFATSNAFGRLWCGFLCIQTIWTDIFWGIERFVEGERSERIRLDKSPYTLEKIAKRTVKYILWLLVSLATGGAWIMYFNDAPTFLRDAINFTLSTKQVSMVLLFTMTTFVLAGFLQGRFCRYMCPWGRFQSAMFDKDTIQVYYRDWRGEPRQQFAKNVTETRKGDCIDCGACVRVCPMDIDIRNGWQMDCIGCALCIDACDDVMRKVNLPTGLIAYDSQRNVEGQRKGLAPIKRTFFHKKGIAFGSIFVLISIIFFSSLANRATLEFTARIHRNPLYVLLKDASIRNRFTVKIQNRSERNRQVQISVEGLKDYTMLYKGRTGKTVTVPLQVDEILPVDIFVTLPRANLQKSIIPFTFVVQDSRKNSLQEIVRHRAVFRTPNG